MVVKGITRCDMIAESIIMAAEKFKDVPVVVRLKGTNSELAQQMVYANQRTISQDQS